MLWRQQLKNMLNPVKSLICICTIFVSSVLNILDYSVSVEVTSSSSFHLCLINLRQHSLTGKYRRTELSLIITST